MNEPTVSGVVLGRVVSVNVGRPQSVQWKGTTVRTAFFKYPVSGRIPIVGTSLEGDGQADLGVHGGVGKALFAYSHRHYDGWAKWLGREPGLEMFGENFTVEGLGGDSVAIGDVLTIGSARFIVAEPRQPCYKVDVRLGVDGAAVHMVRSGAVDSISASFNEGPSARETRLSASVGRYSIM